MTPQQPHEWRPGKATSWWLLLLLCAVCLIPALWGLGQQPHESLGRSVRDKRAFVTAVREIAATMSASTGATVRSASILAALDPAPSSISLCGDYVSLYYGGGFAHYGLVVTMTDDPSETTIGSLQQRMQLERVGPGLYAWLTGS